MNKSVVSALLVLMAVAIPMSTSDLSFAEEIRLSTIVPDQTIVRGKDGAIGNNYRSKTDADVPDGNLIVEGNVGIGTTVLGPSKLKVTGIIESTSGGFKFPDGIIQATAAKALDPVTYTGQQSVTFPNGLIMKMGYKTPGSGAVTVMFGTAFPTACVSVNVTAYKPGGQGFYDAYLSYVSKSDFTYYSPGDQPSFYWTAVGY